ncbi:putative nuclease HARBI1 isoform X1 [Haliotis rufescens]|uniref:putative nuclease HARBI1 isoform X1 n=1 Tax=Haliotis rufescens TaxID=6454 RepID=UPI00201F4049|nr:putative nuclease HARBI1 isoform X1 [Haliotis rufescens]
MAARRNSRIFNERRDILHSLDDNELIQRYRFDRNSIVYICDILEQELSPITQRSCAVSCVTKVLVTLRYLATGKFQICNGDDHGLSQPTISRVIFQTLDSLTSHRILRRFVTFPVQPQEIRRHQQRFYQTANFPGIVGVIDGTHIQIQAPSVNEKEFVNRHNYHSVNTQIVFDSDDHIIDIVARWPGSTHDSRILTTSGLCRMFEGNRLPVSCHLLGDSGYPCRRWILTPFLRPLQGPQTNYNRSHKKTRSCVERGIGQLKRRFHVLHGEIRLSPQKACKVITACAVLHNISKDRNVPMPVVHGNSQSGQLRAQMQGLSAIAPAATGLRYREQFAITYFPCKIFPATIIWHSKYALSINLNFPKGQPI